MDRARPVTAVRAAHSPEVSLRRLTVAASSGSALLPGSALRTLIQLAAMAHPAGDEGRIVGGSFPVADLERLKFVGYIEVAGDGTIELL